MTTRRTFLATTAALGMTILPFAGPAWAQTAENTYATDSGEIVVHPVSHASFVMETPGGTIYADPVGDASMYSEYPAPDLILITHEHGDHFNAETLSALAGENTQIIANTAVYDMLPPDLQGRATELANDATAERRGISIDAVPAYNITEDRLQFHPEERGDNGYVLNIDGQRVYIAGDTEDVPEMRALENIDIAFVPMNLPYTMDVNQAASAVSEFAPSYVYPYHYRGSDPQEFASLVAESGADTQVVQGPWYPEEPEQTEESAE